MGERQKVKLCGKGQDENVGSECPGSANSGDSPTSKGTELQHDFRPSEQTTEVPGTLLFCWGEKSGYPWTSIHVHTSQLSAFTFRHQSLGLLIKRLSSACWILLCRSIQSPSASDFYIRQDQPFTNDQWQSSKNTTLQQRIGTVTLHFSIRKKEIQKYFKNYACKEFHLSFSIKINLKF